MYEPSKVKNYNNSYYVRFNIKKKSKKFLTNTYLGFIIQIVYSLTVIELIL